jgi:DNA anti-recombination protein RmuC
MNIQMSKETNLTKHLKDSKMQGNWGVVLERVLEKSGLEKEENMKYNKASLPKMETSIPRCCN